jgi:hypothetical protein
MNQIELEEIYSAEAQTIVQNITLVDFHIMTYPIKTSS